MLPFRISQDTGNNRNALNENHNRTSNFSTIVHEVHHSIINIINDVVIIC